MSNQHIEHAEWCQVTMCAGDCRYWNSPSTIISFLENKAKSEYLRGLEDARIVAHFPERPEPICCRTTRLDVVKSIDKLVQAAGNGKDEIL